MRYFFVIFISCFIIFGCRKEYSSISDGSISDTTWKISVVDTAPLNQMLEKLQDTAQVDSIELDKGDTLEFYDNTLQIIFPPAVCVGGGGENVTGKAKVEVIFLQKKGDFIRYERPTASNNYLLITGGALYIHVTQNGVPLQIGSGHVTIRYKDPDAQYDMQLFYGDTTANNTGTFDWKLGSPNYGSVTTVWDSASSKIGYELLSQKLEWINCDKFTDSAVTNTTVTTYFPDNYTNNNTAVFIVFKDQRTVMRMQADLEHRLFNAIRIPVGSNVEIISLSLLDDDFYMATKTFTVAGSDTFTLTPEAKTKDEIRTYLDGL